MRRVQCRQALSGRCKAEAAAVFQSIKSVKLSVGERGDSKGCGKRDLCGHMLRGANGVSGDFDAAQYAERCHGSSARAENCSNRDSCGA